MSAHRRGGGNAAALLRRLLLWGLTALGLLLLVGFISYAQLLSWLQGQEFRSALQNELRDRTQADSCAMVGTLSIDANRVSARRLDMLWRSGLLRRVGGKGIHAEVKRSELLDRKLHFTRFMVEEASLDLDFDASREEGERLSQRSGSSGFLAALAPTQLQLDKLDCKDVHATLHHGGKVYSLEDCSLSATPLTPPRGMPRTDWELSLSNGRLRTPLPLLGDCSLKTATLIRRERHVVLSDTRLMLSPGELIVQGALHSPNHFWSADLRANSVDMTRIIGEDWAKRFSGMLYGQLQLSGFVGKGLEQAKGSVRLQQGVLEALPFLENLPVGGSYPYRHLELETATADIDYNKHIRPAWLINNIDLRAKGGWLRVRGHVYVGDDESLSGSLGIGLPRELALRLVPSDSPLHQSLFNVKSAEEDGFLWLHVNLSGTLSEPQEDLSVRLTTLLRSALPDSVQLLREIVLPHPAEAPAEGAAPAAPQAPAPAQLMENAGKAAGDIISTGLRSIF